MTFPQVLAVIVIGAVAHACGQTLRDAFRDWLTNRSIRKMQAGLLKDADEWARSHMAHQPRSVGRGAN